MCVGVLSISYLDNLMAITANGKHLTFKVLQCKHLTFKVQCRHQLIHVLFTGFHQCFASFLCHHYTRRLHHTLSGRNKRRCDLFGKILRFLGFKATEFYKLVKWASLKYYVCFEQNWKSFALYPSINLLQNHSYLYKAVQY